MPNNRNHMGDQTTLVIDGEAIPVTSKSWTWSQETADSNFDDSKNPDRGITSRSPEGELEYDGRKDELERRIMNAPENKHRIILRHNDGGGFRFKGVLVTEISGEGPGDGKRNVTISWSGEAAVPF